MTEIMREHDRLNRAIKFAADCHAGQCRKGKTTPYILHPMEVACLLNSMGGDIDLIIAGMLHDTLEDTDATREDIRQEFGLKVEALVCAHTEDKTKSWQERKEQAITELSNADQRLKMLVLADKLANLRSMARDYKSQGESFWERFNAPKERQEWFYHQMVTALSELKNIPQTSAAYEEMQGIVEKIFDDEKPKIK